MMVERLLIARVCFKYNSKVVLFLLAKLRFVACNARVKFPVMRLVSDVH